MSWNPEHEAPSNRPVPSLEHVYLRTPADYVYTATAVAPFNSRTAQWGGAPYPVGTPPNPAGLVQVAAPSLSQRGWWHIRKMIATYNSAVNTQTGLNNGNYLGYARVGVMLELPSYDLLPSNAAGTHVIGRFLGRKVGHTRITLNDAAATVQILDADVDITVRGGSVVTLKWPEHPFWGVFQQVYLLARHFAQPGKGSP